MLPLHLRTNVPTAILIRWADTRFARSFISMLMQRKRRCTEDTWVFWQNETRTDFPTLRPPRGSCYSWELDRVFVPFVRGLHRTLFGHVECLLLRTCTGSFHPILFIIRIPCVIKIEMTKQVQSLFDYIWWVEINARSIDDQTVERV